MAMLFYYFTVSVAEEHAYESKEDTKETMSRDYDQKVIGYVCRS
jgi:hypothetical protein